MEAHHNDYYILYGILEFMAIVFKDEVQQTDTQRTDVTLRAQLNFTWGKTGGESMCLLPTEYTSWIAGFWWNSRSQFCYFSFKDENES